MELVVVKRPEATKGFILVPKRWVVERSFAWLSRFRRLGRDLERLPSTLVGSHALAACIDHREDDVHDTLQRVVEQEWSAGFDVVGQFGTLQIGGFWSGHTPKTPPFVVPVRNRSHVHGFPVQHSLDLKMSGTERRPKTPRG